MKALLNPARVPEHGLVILKPSNALMSLFYGPIIVSSAGEEYAGHKPGLLPEFVPSLASGSRFTAFFMNAEVIKAAGGSGALRQWVVRKHHCCEWICRPDEDDYHHKELKVTPIGASAVRLCWHHDNTLVDFTAERVESIAAKNAAAFVVDAIRRHFRIPDDNDLTDIELACWAIVNGVAQHLPDPLIRRLLKMSENEPITSVMRECDLDVNPAIPEQLISMVSERERPILRASIEPAAPAQYMLKPKIMRFECKTYTDWVKTQACCGCSRPADDPHHIIGNGFGGTATKAGDFHCFPLCRQCHDQLHEDVDAWERKHNSQEYHTLRTQERALGLGIITLGKA